MHSSMRQILTVLLVMLSATGVNANVAYQVIDLGTLSGEFNYYSVAHAINNKGEIVGESYKVNLSAPQHTSRATLFDPTGARNNIDLGTLGGNNSSAYSINDLGQIVGSAQNALGVYRATLFDPTGSGNNIDLGRLGGSQSYARSINNLGQIVGYADNALVYRTATLFDPTGSGNNIDLNTLIDSASGLTLYSAQCINNHGWIVGRIPHEGNAYLLIPEPPIGAEVDIDPDTLNLNSKGKWITCYIWLPEKYDVADVNSQSVFFEEVIGAAWIWVDEQTQVIMAKFSRSDFQEMLTESGKLGEVELTVRGELIDGTTFEGMDIIRVIDKGKK